MKKTLFSVMITLIVVLTSSKPVKIACIGNSITYGAYIDNREADCYPTVLQQMLGNDYEVVNYGMNGRVMLQDGDYPYMKEKMYGEVKAWLPDIVTIMLGTNDSKPHNWQYGANFENDYATMIRELRALPSHPKIYLCLPPWAQKHEGTINDSTIVASIIPTIKRLADRFWLDIIDTHSTLLNMPEKYADPVHPNVAGAKMLAVEIFKALERNGDTGKPGKRILYIGDSITDNDWAKADGKQSSERNHYDMNHLYGHGYTGECASYFLVNFPERRYKFYNRGVSGDRLVGLEKRWDTDVFAVHPDIVSIMIGINDTSGHTLETFDFAAWEAKYRALLDKTLAFDSEIKFVLCTPFMEKTGAIGRSDTYENRKAVVNKLSVIVRKIAADYNAVLIPIDELMNELVKSDKSGNDKYWVWDGIHPTYPSHRKIADLWMELTQKIMK